MIQPDLATRGRRMYKTALSHVNACMGYRAALGEQNQITGSDPVICNRIAPSIEFGHSARRCDLCACLVHVANQATAVKSRFRGIAAIPVGRANQTDSVDGHIARLIGGEPRRVVDVFWKALGISPGWRRAATAQQKGEGHQAEHHRFVNGRHAPTVQDQE